MQRERAPFFTIDGSLSGDVRTPYLESVVSPDDPPSPEEPPLYSDMGTVFVATMGTFFVAGAVLLISMYRRV